MPQQVRKTMFLAVSVPCIGNIVMWSRGSMIDRLRTHEPPIYEAMPIGHRA